jgi:hypothetical protein
LLKLERGENGSMVEKKYVCDPKTTVNACGIQAGSRLFIEVDMEGVA